MMAERTCLSTQPAMNQRSAACAYQQTRRGMQGAAPGVYKLARENDASHVYSAGNCSGVFPSARGAYIEPSYKHAALFGLTLRAFSW